MFGPNEVLVSNEDEVAGLQFLLNNMLADINRTIELVNTIQRFILESSQSKIEIIERIQKELLNNHVES